MNDESGLQTLGSYGGSETQLTLIYLTITLMEHVPVNKGVGTLNIFISLNRLIEVPVGVPK